jgi:DNA-binding transcriptional LysR family regulator
MAVDPVLALSSLLMIRDAVRAGVGVARLPISLVMRWLVAIIPDGLLSPKAAVRRTCRERQVRPTSLRFRIVDTSALSPDRLTLTSVRSWAPRRGC